MKYCPSCGTVLDDDARFCTGCGAKLGEESQSAPTQAPVDPVQQAPAQPPTQTPYQQPVQAPVQPNYVQGQPYTYPANGVPGQPVYIVKQQNPIFDKMGKIIKDLFVHPSAAIDTALGDTNPVLGIIPTFILFVASLIYWMMFCGKLDMELGAEFYGLGALLAFLFTIFFTVYPVLTAFVSTKLSGRNVSFVSLFNAFAWNNIYVCAALIISGIFALIILQSVPIFFGLIIGIKLYSSISILHKVSGNLMDSAKVFWGTFGVAFAVKAVTFIIVALIVNAMIQNAISSAFSSFLW